MLVRLAIDFENPCKQWWDEGGRELWEGVAEAPDASQVIVDEALANSWLSQASAIPGWNDGPEFAPHPVCTRPVNDDEDPPSA
jgi:hypothetical protein